METSLAITDEWMSIEQLAEWLGVEKYDIYRLNSRGEGPERFRIGQKVRYRVIDVMAWLKTRQVT